MTENPSGYVPLDKVKPMGHPFQLRMGGFAFHYDSYTPALEEFHALADDDPSSQITLWQLGYWAPGKPEWHMVSLANPHTGKGRAWTNLFAGLTLSRLFFLRNADRRALAERHWPAPPDAVSWKYAPEVPPLEDQVAEALALRTPPVTESPVLDAEPEVEPETDVEALDITAWANDPGCRVDETTLRRRLAMGWDLVRAMTVPMTPISPDEYEWTIVNGRRRYLPKYRGIPS